MTKNHVIKKFDEYNIFDIDINKLRSKIFYSRMISNRDSYYQKYNKYLTSKKIPCHLCGKKKKKNFEKFKKYILNECLNCGAVYNNLDIKKFQNSGFFNKNKTKYEDFKAEMVKTFQYRKKNFGIERFNYIKKKIFKKKNSINVLDYGCGSGYFLSVLRDHKIKACGIEVDSDAARFCKSKNLDVKMNSLEKEKDNNYDLITMFDSIEHLYDPINLFKEAVKKLKPKSYILAFTPNIHSLSFELMGVNHNMLAVFDHICFFNEKSLNYLCSKTGLKIKSIEYFGLDVKDYFQFIENKHSIRLNNKLNRFSNLVQAVIDSKNLSNSMRIIFQKK